MENKENEIVALKKVLKTKDADIILSHIDKMREFGQLSLVTEILAAMVAVDNKKVRWQFMTLLSDIKDDTMPQILVEALKKDEYRSIQAEIVAACWQSSNDFTTYFSDFVDVLIDGDDHAAIEASTAIGEIHANGKISNYSQDIERLRTAALNSSPDRQPIIIMTVNILSE